MGYLPNKKGGLSSALVRIWGVAAVITAIADNAK